MNTIDFCYWLQGHFELNPNTSITPEQTEVIKNHLHLVFKHEIKEVRQVYHNKCYPWKSKSDEVNK